MAVDPARERRILLVDCDAFFVQVARLEDPEGAGKASLLIVGGSPTGRGVVTSASYEARAYGVRSAMPTAHALRLCPKAMVVGVPRGVISQKSHEVRDALADLSPVVQAASVDEFYLDLSGTERLFGEETLERTAWRIREAVLERTKISVSLGGGTRRVIAKLATTRAKPAGVWIVPPGDEQAFLNQLDLADLPGVGPALVEALRKRGLVRVEDALAVQPEWLEKWFGQRRGAWLYRRIRGMDNSRVDPSEQRKSISAERTFHEDVNDDDDLERRLLALAGSVGATLRRKNFRARTVTVKLRDHDFTTRQHSRTVPEPIESNSTIYEIARELLRELRSKRRTPSRLLGVGLTGLAGEGESHPLALFEEGVVGESERDRNVSRVVDRLADRFGDGVLVPGRVIGRARSRERPPHHDNKDGDR
ncbi:MAG: DNA polymerase IV [Gemmatimonadetes bacterium]|nr:DNA polymerase IV [Gemmatimonadota bacterium]MDA1103785.1 DNA polymerase IV [Gemmatimonadota bacterium]